MPREDITIEPLKEKEKLVKETNGRVEIQNGRYILIWDEETDYKDLIRTE